MQLHSSFRDAMRGFDMQALESQSSTIFGLTPDFRLGYFNAAWRRFALDNGGAEVLDRWPLGRQVLTAIAEPLRSHYWIVFESVVRSRQVVEFDYECSGRQIFRQFRMRLQPLGRGDGLLVVNSLRSEGPHPAERSPHRWVESSYRSHTGLVVQCSICRRIRNVVEVDRWDWVPELVARPHHRTSHGLCRVCLDTYYPDLAADESEGE